MIAEQDLQIANTDEIIVSVCPFVDKIMSDGKVGYYLMIENQTESKIQILGKNWQFTDEKGNNFSEDSVGFAGEIPELEPGEYFEFAGVSPIDSLNAVFYGSCHVKIGNDNFVKEVKIPAFTLSDHKEELPKALLN